MTSLLSLPDLFVLPDTSLLEDVDGLLSRKNCGVRTLSVWDNFKEVDHVIDFGSQFDVALSRESSAPAETKSTQKLPKQPSASSKDNKKRKSADREHIKKSESTGQVSAEVCVSRLADAARGRLHPQIQVTPRYSGRKPVKSFTHLDKEDPAMQEAIELFNKKPKNGIEYLVTNGIIQDTPEAIATFLFQCNELDKVKLGEVLSEENHTDIVKHFIAFIDFNHVDFDLALRRTLYCFRLPGEAQKIDRIVKTFASQYYLSHQSDGVFKNDIEVYVSAFATIMLNTDAYNDQVKKKTKMTEKQFIDNIHFNPGTEEIPSEFLTELYERINNEEIKENREEAVFPDAIKKGFLFLHSRSGVGHGNRWKRRWVVLSDHTLYICKKQSDINALYGISLKNCSLGSAGTEKNRRFCVRLNLPVDTTLDPEGRMSHILLSGSTAEELDKWTKAVEAHILTGEDK